MEHVDGAGWVVVAAFRSDDGDLGPQVIRGDDALRDETGQTFSLFRRQKFFAFRDVGPAQTCACGLAFHLVKGIPPGEEPLHPHAVRRMEYAKMGLRQGLGREPDFVHAPQAVEEQQAGPLGRIENQGRQRVGEAAGVLLPVGPGVGETLHPVGHRADFLAPGPLHRGDHQTVGQETPVGQHLQVWTQTLDRPYCGGLPYAGHTHQDEQGLGRQGTPARRRGTDAQSLRQQLEGHVHVSHPTPPRISAFPGVR